MPFVPGDRVHLAGIGSGRVIEARSGDRYAVEIKGRMVVAAGRDLELAASVPTAPPTARGAGDGGRHHLYRQQWSSPSIDLHGKTVTEALEAIEAFINEALLADHAEVRIIHGHGSGRVKAAVHRHLRGMRVVSRIRLDPANAGATIVTFG